MIAQIDTEADIRRINMEAEISKGRVINITHQIMYEIQVDGAVKNPGSIKVPKGTKTEDLLKILEFLDSSDTTSLKKKRILKDNEKVTIPVLGGVEKHK